LERGFIARSGKGFGFPTSLRVTIGSEEENAGMIEAIKGFLNATK
jgi:histidinol-phosphate aminotransferase